jgi:catechol 2,3-dioxygenase-like lactoylglutathione lyase family enzyme
MEPRLSFVTLVVRDLDASRRFYVEGLGWPVEFEAPGEVVMIRVADKVVFSLWQERDAVG